MSAEMLTQIVDCNYLDGYWHLHHKNIRFPVHSSIDALY